MQHLQLDGRPQTVPGTRVDPIDKQTPKFRESRLDPLAQRRDQRLGLTRVRIRDYQSVLSPGAIIAGPCAEELRNGEMPQSSIDWLKTNFFKTELELGRCLRLPQEGPCECDLYLNCAKFVTTPEYAPRLRRRPKQELDLIEDAQQRSWDKEVERHRCTANRIEQLLKELGEPIEGQEAVY